MAVGWAARAVVAAESEASQVVLAGAASVEAALEAASMEAVASVEMVVAAWEAVAREVVGRVAVEVARATAEEECVEGGLLAAWVERMVVGVGRVGQ